MSTFRSGQFLIRHIIFKDVNTPISHKLSQWCVASLTQILSTTEAYFCHRRKQTINVNACFCDA